MMTWRLRIIILLGMLIVIMYLVKLIRKKRMSFTYALGWLFIAICIAILTMWPTLLDRLAIILGIASPVNMLFFFGFCFAVVVIFALSLTISHLSDRVKTLSQEIAIIRKDMYENYKRISEK